MKARYFVYLRRHIQPTPEALAEGAGLCRADAMRIVHSKLPQPVAVLGDAETVRDRILNLRAFGLDAMAVTPDAVRRFDPAPHRSLAEFPDGVRMIVVGKILQESTSERVVNIEPGLSPSIGLAFMGAPVPIRLGERTSVKRTSGDESFCCLFRTREECWILRESELDYRELGPKPPLAREQSFLEAVGRVRARYPEAVFDDRLFRFPAGVQDFDRSERIYGGTRETTRTGTNAPKAYETAHLLYLLAFGAA